MFVLSIKTKRLINKLYNNGPKIDSCGVPLTISYQSLCEELIFICCLRFDKELCIKFKPVLSMP